MNALKSAITSRARDLWAYRNLDAAPGKHPPARPRLFVDVSVIIQHDAQTGIQRVVRAVWSNLVERSAAAFEVVPVFATRTHGYRVASPDFLSRSAMQRLPGRYVRAQAGDKFLGLDLSAHLLPTYQRQVSGWREAGATVHLLVYDLLPIQRPHWFNNRTVRNFSRWIDMVRTHCDQALCISADVAKELDAFLGASADRPRIGKIKLAGDIEASHPSRGIDERLAEIIAQLRAVPTILMVGTVEPRKGYDVALAAFEHLWRSLGPDAPALVIVGKPGWRTDALQDSIRNHPEQGTRLFWLPNVSDEGLGRLYDACSAVFSASHGEGFGLPAVEAALHGRHALVRDLAVFREQQLPNLSFFEEDDPQALAASLQGLLQRAKAPPPATVTACWHECVTDMLEQLGFNELPPARARAVA